MWRAPLLALAILAGCSSGGAERPGEHHARVLVEAHAAGRHPAPKPAEDEGFWAGFWSAVFAILLGGDGPACLD